MTRNQVTSFHLESLNVVQHSNADLVKGFWQLLSEQQWDLALGLLHPNFQATWPQSREKMTANNFIEVNRNYPGNHKIEVLHAFEVGDKVLTKKLIIK